MTKDVNFVIDRAMMAVFGDGGVPVGERRAGRRRCWGMSAAW